MTSTFSGALSAAASERATTSRNAASSNRLVLARPCRSPKLETTVRRPPPELPLVAPPREAKRKLSVSWPSSRTEQPCAFESARMRRPSASASVWSMNMDRLAALEIVARSVEHVDAAEARGRRAMRDRRALPRLAFAARERAAEMIGGAVAKAVHRVPERLVLGLIGEMHHQRTALAVADLVPELAAELEVPPLLVDAPAAVADDVDAAVDAGDQVVDARRLQVRPQRDVRHALDRKRAGPVRIGAAVRPRFPDQVRLADRHLIVPEYPAADDGKARIGTFHAIVVVAHGGQPALLAALGVDVHQRAAELQLAALIGGHEGGSGEIRLPSERTVELGGVSDRLVDREPEIRAVDHEIVFSRLEALGAELLARLRRGLARFL